MNRPGRAGWAGRGSVRAVGLAATVLIGLLTAGCGADPAPYRDDRGDITQLVYRFYADTGEGKFDNLNQVLSDNVVVSSPGGGLTTGRDKVIANSSRAAKSEDRTEHLVSNVLVDVNGDNSTVEADVVQSFGSSKTPQGKLAPSPTLTINSRMHFQAVRTAQGWRLSRIEGDLLWATGTQPGQ
jgi:hypothetical protein